MSADNGIYILKTTDMMKHEEPWSRNVGPIAAYRVAHAQAIDNFDYYKYNQHYNFGAYLLSVWRDSKVFYDEGEAYKVAQEMSKDFYILEYGISEIDASGYCFYGS